MYALELIAFDSKYNYITFDGGIYDSREAARDAGLANERLLLTFPEVEHTTYNIVKRI